VRGRTVAKGQGLDGWHDKCVAIAREWNRFVPDYNPSCVLLATSAGRWPQAMLREDVLKPRRRGWRRVQSSRRLVSALTTVRTIVDRRDQHDRSSAKHLARVRRNMGEERT
jgi:hypothetical protein